MRAITCDSTSPFGQVDPADLAKAEALVNQKIFEELPVTTVETDIESAKRWVPLRYLVKSMERLSGWLVPGTLLLNFVKSR